MEKRVLSYYDSDTAVSRRNRNYGTMNSDCDTIVGPNDKNPPKNRFKNREIVWSYMYKQRFDKF